MEKWLSIDDAVAQIGVSKRTIYRRIKDGKIQKREMNGETQILVTVEDTMSQDSAGVVTQFKSEIQQLRQQIDGLTDSDNELVTQLRSEIDYLREQNDHMTQLLAMTQKNITSLTDQVSDKDKLIEDMRQKPPTRWERFKQTFGLSR